MGEKLNFDDFIKALRTGSSYVSDGFTHLIDFSINDIKVGKNKSEIYVSKGEMMNISVRAAGMLDIVQSEIGQMIKENIFCL